MRGMSPPPRPPRAHAPVLLSCTAGEVLVCSHGRAGSSDQDGRRQEGRVIKRIKEGGPAWYSRRLDVGDCVLSVNEARRGRERE